MQQQLSEEFPPSLSEAVSEIRSSIQVLNNPQKIFILSQQFITNTIEGFLQQEGILNCRLNLVVFRASKIPSFNL